MRFEAAGGFPSIDHRKRQIHQNEIRPLPLRRCNSRLAVGSRDQLEFLLQQLREQVPVEVDILDDQKSFSWYRIPCRFRRPRRPLSFRNAVPLKNCRQSDREGRALAYDAVDEDIAAEQVGEMSADRQP